MGHSVKKAMILAAGLGTRMAPVTDLIPKPLVPILNIPNIVHNIFLLKQAGIEDVVINAFHLGPKLMAALGDGSRYGVRIRYSVEEILLGTGGGVKFAEPLLGNEPFILCNSDLITDLDLRAAIDFHFARNALATMVLLDDEIQKRKYANVGTDGAGQLCQLPSKKTQAPVKTGIFTGIHILQPEIHQYLEPVFSGINQVLYPALMEAKPAQALGYYAPPQTTSWLDTGEVSLFWETSMRLLEDLRSADNHLRPLLEQQGFQESQAGIWSEKGSPLPSGVAHGEPLMLAAGSQFGAGARLEEKVVVGSGSVIGEGASIRNSVLLPGARVPAGLTIVDKIVFGDRILETRKS